MERAAQSDTSAALAPATIASPASTAAAPADQRVYFGSLHLHTAYSFDAWSLFGVKATPEMAYRYARGETVDYFGTSVRRAWPLDFVAVTDHAEFMGVMNQLDDPASAVAQTPLGRRILADPRQGFYVRAEARRDPAIAAQIAQLRPRQAMQGAWARQMAFANAAYRPGAFTTFVAYEWSAQKDAAYTLHRNVIFKGDRAPLPFSSTDSARPEDLWSHLETLRAQGVEGLAIPHNSNVSNGFMFDWNDSDGKPIDAAYALRRALNEPLAEIVQNKGASETHPELSANDEFASFEIFDRINQRPTVKPTPNGSYIRQAWGRGLVVASKVGANPYRMGVVGASDNHNALTSEDENRFAGAASGLGSDKMLPDGDEGRSALGLLRRPSTIDVQSHLAGRQGSPEDLSMFSSSGLTGVWAEANTREAIYAAFRRKETFATSGPRIRVRMFGGWDFAPDMLRNPNWAAKAYARGAPMGGDLPASGRAARGPSFIVQALKAPDSGNLDRIQIIKVWQEDGRPKEKIFEVALSGGRRVNPRTGKAPPVGNTVDLKTATYRNSIGATTLQAVWRDSAFDPARPAVYYARVLEIPTPRWSTLLAAKRNLPRPGNRDATIQERAWSSPIWYARTAPGSRG